MLLAVIQEVKDNSGCVGESCGIGSMINFFLITIYCLNMIAVIVSSLLYYRCLVHEKLLSQESEEIPYQRVAL